MNALGEDPRPEGADEPDIILLGLDKKSFYLLKGDNYLNQILLADGDFPTPVLCVHVHDVFDAKRLFGDDFNLGQCWGIHPEIVARLRNEKKLIETEA